LTLGAPYEEMFEDTKGVIRRTDKEKWQGGKQWSTKHYI